ncbi:UNVERIFIED_CONTAM: Acetoacetyl-CoA synthetase [Trichonephila clavipes]
MDNRNYTQERHECIEKVIIIPTKEESKLKDISAVNNSCFLGDFLSGGKNADGSIPDLVFEQFPFDHPVFINFTSGTTGLPKGLVHSAGCLIPVNHNAMETRSLHKTFNNVLLLLSRDQLSELLDLHTTKIYILQFNEDIELNYINLTAGKTFLPLLRDFGLHNNLDRTTVTLAMQPVGWNLWNLYVGNLMLGSSLLLYDGLPCFLSKTAFWDIMDKYKVTFAFIVTSIIDTFEKEEIIPVSNSFKKKQAILSIKSHSAKCKRSTLILETGLDLHRENNDRELTPDCKLEHLKMIAVGASPVKLQNVDFILQKVKPDVFVGCLYGATEVIGVFSGFDYNIPVNSSQIQCPALGVDIRIFDDEGNSILGKSGELVIATPTPSLPVCVWNDEGDAKMQETYLSKFPGVWAQSDEAWIDPKTRGMIIIGRSDNTIKQHGERFVSEEIYWAIHDIEEIADSICVAQSNGSGDGRAVLFVKMKNGHILDREMIMKIEEKILRELTIFYVPKVILPVKDIPYNLNGKRMESVVKKIVNTNQIPEVNNIRNPECLKQYYNIPQLQDF